MVRRGLSFSDLGGVSQFFRIRSGLCFLELFLEGGGQFFELDRVWCQFSELGGGGGGLHFFG